MAKPRGRQEPARVVEAREAGKTGRTVARWDAAKRIIPAGFAAWATVVTAGKASDHAAAINWILGGLLLAGGACALAKILWDRNQKIRQRERLTGFEIENRNLRAEVEGFKIELAEKRGEVSALRSKTGEGGSSR